MAEVTDDAKGLIAQHIHSVEQLEVLLLLRAAPEKEWTAVEVARALVSQPESAEQRLADLAGRELIVHGDDRYRYDASRPSDKAVNDLAEAWATRRTTVIGLVFSKPSDAVTSFSDAFRIRRRD
jgi:hypothetical protein